MTTVDTTLEVTLIESTHTFIPDEQHRMRTTVSLPDELAEVSFLAGLAGFQVLAPVAEDWPVIAATVQRYAELPLGGTDAALAVLADRLGTRCIVTLDRRHFSVLRTHTGARFDLLPD